MKFGVTANGFITKTFNDVIESFEARGKKYFGNDWTLDQYTPEGAVLFVAGYEIAENWKGTKAAYDGDFLDLCEGIQLDYKGKEEDVPRSQGKVANTILEFTTSKELNIPMGTVVKKGGTDLLYSTVSSLDIGPTFKGEVQAVSVDVGEDYNGAIGQINELANGIVGVTSVVNKTPATGGEGIEPDFKYRPRIKLAKSSRGGSTVNSITSELLKLENVNNVLVLENPTDSVDVNGVDPGKIKIFIDGVSNISIAEKIHEFKADGIETMGNIEFEVTNIGGQKITERFNLLTKKQLYVKIQVNTISGSLTDEIKKSIKENIIKYLEEIQLGDIEDRVNEVVLNQISAQAYFASENIKKLTTLISLTDPPTGTADIPIPVGEYFYADETTIEVI